MSTDEEAVLDDENDFFEMQNALSAVFLSSLILGSANAETDLARSATSHVVLRGEGSRAPEHNKANLA